MDCLYKLFKYRFSGKFFAKSGQVFDIMQQALDFNQGNKGFDRMPRNAKKNLLGEKLQKAFIQLLQKNKNNQNTGSVFAEGIEKVKRTEFELELMKFVDCFPDGHGNFDSNLVSFKKSL